MNFALHATTVDKSPRDKVELTKEMFRGTDVYIQLTI